jgi:hypothetical protein
MSKELTLIKKMKEMAFGTRRKKSSKFKGLIFQSPTGVFWDGLCAMLRGRASSRA